MVRWPLSLFSFLYHTCFIWYADIFCRSVFFYIQWWYTDLVVQYLLLSSFTYVLYDGILIFLLVACSLQVVHYRSSVSQGPMACLHSKILKILKLYFFKLLWLLLLESYWRPSWWSSILILSLSHCKFSSPLYLKGEIHSTFVLHPNITLRGGVGISNVLLWCKKGNRMNYICKELILS